MRVGVRAMLPRGFLAGVVREVGPPLRFLVVGEGDARGRIVANGLSSISAGGAGVSMGAATAIGSRLV